MTQAAPKSAPTAYNCPGIIATATEHNIVITQLEQAFNCGPKTGIAESHPREGVPFKRVGPTGDHQRLWFKLPSKLKHRMLHQV